MVYLEVEIARQKSNRRSLVHDAATLVIRKDKQHDCVSLHYKKKKKRTKVIKSNTKGINKSICK